MTRDPDGIVTWHLGASTFRAHPELGARWLDWTHQPAGQAPRPFLHWPEGVRPGGSPWIHGGNPILFPFPGRSFEGGQIGFWRDPAGVRRPMPMHGFAHDGAWEREHLDATGFTARLVPDARAQAAYPFTYAFRATYEFRENGCRVRLSLENRDTQALPWCAGHHCYFRLPNRPGANRADYRLALEAAHAVHHAADGRLVAAPEGPQPTSFADPRLVDRIHLGLRGESVRFGHCDGTETLRLRRRDAAPNAAWVTWSESPEAPYYCVEPWMGPPNAVAHGLGLHWVAPGKTEHFDLEIVLEDTPSSLAQPSTP